MEQWQTLPGQTEPESDSQSSRRLTCTTEHLPRLLPTSTTSSPGILPSQPISLDDFPAPVETLAQRLSRQSLHMRLSANHRREQRQFLLRKKLLELFDNQSPPPPPSQPTPAQDEDIPPQIEQTPRSPPPIEPEQDDEAIQAVGRGAAFWENRTPFTSDVPPIRQDVCGTIVDIDVVEGACQDAEDEGYLDPTAFESQWLDNISRLRGPEGPFPRQGVLRFKRSADMGIHSPNVVHRPIRMRRRQGQKRNRRAREVGGTSIDTSATG